MAFDPRELAPLLGGLGGATGGGNGFLRGWMRAQQEAEQRRLQQEQMGMLQEDRDFRRQQAVSQDERASAADARAEQDQAIQIAQTFRDLLGDETIDDPDAFNQRLTFASQFAPKLGVEPGFLESLRPAPTVFQRRKAAKLLKTIETDPQIKRLVDAGEDIGSIVYEREDLGPNPERPDGKPLWSIGEIHRLAQRPTPAQPLPKPAQARVDTRSLEVRAAEALERGDTETYNRLIQAAQDMANARREPDKPAQAPQGSPQWVVTSSGAVRHRIPQPGDMPRDPVAERNKPDDSASPYAAERSERTVQSVDDLLGKVNRWTTGFGSLLARIPETDAANFDAELDTLKANIAFNELTAMREASKTGGALGQVSNIELGLLQSALGALRANQSPANLKAQLMKIRGSVNRWRKAQGLPEIPSPDATTAPPPGRGAGPRANPFRR